MAIRFADSKRPSPDAAAARYFLLDMGKQKYGDCILCLVGGHTILIDGGHPGDFDGQPTSDSIPDQMGAILGTEPPYDIDLLVVTHCHLDHIGCLPKMVTNGVLKVQTALVADERLGWGKRISGPDTDVLPAPPRAARVVAALREESRADDFEGDDAIKRFLQDAVTLEQTYKGMLKALKDAGTKIVRYGRDDHLSLEQQYASAKLQILGPSAEHLEICRKAIASSMQDAVDNAMRLSTSDAAVSDVELYRTLASTATQDATADGSRLGAALNDQSIVLALGPASNRVLLTGDMQFSDPAVNGLDDEMTALRQAVADVGPYRFIKLSHHGSHNGVDESVRAEWGDTKLFAVSGGSDDPGHPAREVLQLLKAEQDDITWARTDKNGLIEIRPSSQSDPFRIAKGSLNDSTANPGPRRRNDVVASAEAAATMTQAAKEGVLEVTARIPDHLRRVVITVESDLRSDQPKPGSQPENRSTPSRGSVSTQTTSSAEETFDSRRIGGGRRIPPLLFVTNRRVLAQNIGQAEANEALSLIEQSGQRYVDVTDSARAVETVQRALAANHRGVVVLGGYDVLPAKRLDTLPPEVREALGDESETDADNFIVWSDALYGDADGDDLPELPVSRIPDGKSGELVLNALRAPGFKPEIDRLAILNAKRPFAEDIVQLVRGGADAYVSLPKTHADIDERAAAMPLVYFMLHGLDTDATRFVGQEPEYPESFNIDQVPPAGNGVVFTGCCWGALPVRQIASRVLPGRSITPRTVEQSIALRYLHAGYAAFVGCTGSHYSPPGKDHTHGKPMHVAFWEEIGAGRPPAEALFAAKIRYLRDMPHGLEDIWDIAVEHKTLRQFTCLGLGW